MTNTNIFPFKKYQKKWEKFQVNKKDGKPIYILEMWPYPSGDLHMGHVRNYTIGDIVSRLRHLQGYKVFHPMGWDAHGLPAENAAREHNIHPKVWTLKNIDNMRTQLKSLFLSYDWDYEMATCHETYYKFQQEIFIAMFKAGYIKKKEEYVNWDPVDETVLANEQVINGKGWRSGALVQQKLLSQWFCSISDFSEILLKDLNRLENHWPPQIITMQKNWIGKNNGYLINFENIEVFTKSPYFLPEVEFLAVAPDSKYGISFYKKYSIVEEFVTNNPSDRMNKEKDKRGIFTGDYIINPYNKEKIPIYVANYVLGDYGTGVVMGVPSICENDFDFAVFHKIPIKHSLKKEKYLERELTDKEVQIKQHLIENNMAKKISVYKLKDWCISRQRYWGTPIPIIYCDKCGILPNENLPVHLPNAMEHMKNNFIKCPKCEGNAKKETDTMDTFFDSSWYSWRFPSSKNTDSIFDDNLKEFPSVDLYIGGPEHAVLHLLFARFFGKVLKILGYIQEDEPFKNLYTQGMICLPTYKNQVTNNYINPKEVFEEEGKLYTLNEGFRQPVEMGHFEKMSKSKKNTVSPEDILNKYGVDSLRLFIVSDTPCNKDLQWNEKSLNGCWCFNNRIWNLTNIIKNSTNKDNSKDDFFQEYSRNIFYIIIKDLEAININVAIAQIRILVNYIEENKNNISYNLLTSQWRDLLKLYWCLCPVISMECLEIMGDSMEFNLPFNRIKTQGDIYTLVVQKNGKTIGLMEVKTSLEKEEIIPIVIKTHESCNNYKNVVFVPYKVINFVL